MARSPLFSDMARLVRLAMFCERTGDATGTALRAAREAEHRALDGRMTRRGMLLGTGAAVMSAALARARPGAPAPRIAIVGGGLAGLTCADTLRAAGLRATVYEARADRVGGRCWSVRGFFPGQVCEAGGEFIDTGHQTMRRYANEFGLAREDNTNEKDDETFSFGGVEYSEDEVVGEYRKLVPRMRADLHGLSNEPTYFDHTAGDAALDAVNLRAYLDTRCADLPVARAALDAAYVAEYGRETSEQSCLNMVLFLHADRRRKFTPFGVFSDERFHLVSGNDGIAAGIAARLPGPIEMNRRLVELRRGVGGPFELVFADGAVRAADFVVMTLPFSVLRTITLHPNLGIPALKLGAINGLGYGNNAKTMIGFNGRPWRDLGRSGACLTNLPNVQNVWETNWSRGGARGILTDYAGGARGAAIGGLGLQTQVAAFLSDLDTVLPGVDAGATRDGGGNVLALRRHWPSDPFSRGSYTCYLPGQFTGLAGLEGTPVGRLKFAGEHTDSFYSWQGFMEGACLSGIRAAHEVLADLK